MGQLQELRINVTLRTRFQSLDSSTSQSLKGSVFNFLSFRKIVSLLCITSVNSYKIEEDSCHLSQLCNSPPPLSILFLDQP